MAQVATSRRRRHQKLGLRASPLERDGRRFSMADARNRGRRRGGFGLRGQLRGWPHGHRDRSAVSRCSGRGLWRDRGGRTTPGQGASTRRAASADRWRRAHQARARSTETTPCGHRDHRLLRGAAPPGGSRSVGATRGAGPPARSSSLTGPSFTRRGAARSYLGDPAGGLHRPHCERVADCPVHRLGGAIQVRRPRGVPAAAGRAPLRHVRGRLHPRGGRLHLRDPRHALRPRRSRAPRHRGNRARHRLQGGEIRAA